MKENTNAPIYTLTGTVIHGRGIGKHVGTPTANMEIAKNTFLPKTGVYVADILLSDNRYYGVTHIGARPTLDNDDSVSIETHIFDFDKDIYGCTITVNPVSYTHLDVYKRQLVCCKLLCAVAAPHVYEAVTATFTCAGNTFTAKGKTILTPGWKELRCV